jgi:hypothetical protein
MSIKPKELEGYTTVNTRYSINYKLGKYTPAHHSYSTFKSDSDTIYIQDKKRHSPTKENRPVQGY